MTTKSAVSALVSQLNENFSQLHTSKEDAFWQSYMGLGENAEEDRARLGQLETQLQAWLQDPERLQAVSEAMNTAQGHPDEVALQGWHKTLSAHAISSAEGRSLAA